MSYLKVGDKVKIIPRALIKDPGQSPGYTRWMSGYGGKIATVTRSSKMGKTVSLSIDGGNYSWLETWLEPFADPTPYLFSDEEFEI